MQEPQRLDDTDQETENLLSGLQPKAPPRVTAESVIYAARLRQQRRHLWAWRGIAAALALALILQFTLTPRPGRPLPPPSPAIVVKAADPPSPPVNLLPMTGDDYIATRNRALAFGVQSVGTQDRAPLPPLKPRTAASHEAPQSVPPLFRLLPTLDAEVQS